MKLIDRPSLFYNTVGTSDYSYIVRCENSECQKLKALRYGLQLHDAFNLDRTLSLSIETTMIDGTCSGLHNFH